MSLTSKLNPSNSVMTGLANGAIVIAIYQHSMGAGILDMRTAQPHNTDIETSRKQAAYLSAAVLSVVFLLTRDRNAAMIGGLVLAGVDLTVKHANAVSPETGKIQAEAGSVSIDPSMAQVYPMPDYGNDDANVS
jgi:hypothetical protein